MRIWRTDYSYRYRGFTLMEVMIGMLLLTIIAGAVGVAMVHFSQRTSQARLTVTNLQKQQRLAQIVTDDLTRLTGITVFTENTFQFNADNGGTIESITYAWNSTSGTFTRRTGSSAPVQVSDDVTLFALEYLIDEQDYLYALEMYLRQGEDETDTILRTIELTNPIEHTGMPEPPAIVVVFRGN